MTNVVLTVPNYAPLTAHIIEPDHAERQLVEQFICQRYWMKFNACLHELPRRLLVVRDQQRQLIAACAIQYADERPLFSECYLPNTIQDTLAAHGIVAQRQQLAEVGSMACLRPRDLAPLVSAIVCYLTQQQKQALIFTATAPLRRFLKHLQLPLQRLADASADALSGDSVARWGDYYQSQPQVMAGRLCDGHFLLGKVSDRMSQPDDRHQDEQVISGHASGHWESVAC